MPAPKQSPAPITFAGISTAAVEKATGKSWAAWIEALTKARAADLAHTDIVNVLCEKHRLPDWWAQMVTVGYEQHIGRRIVGQSCTGKFNVTLSRTVPLSAAEAHAYFTDARKRVGWLPREVVVRRATAPKSVRLGFPAAPIAGIALTAKGSGKCSIGISHDGFSTAEEAAQYKEFWRDACEKLLAKISG